MQVISTILLYSRPVSTCFVKLLREGGITYYLSIRGAGEGSRNALTVNFCQKGSEKGKKSDVICEWFLITRENNNGKLITSKEDGQSSRTATN